MAEAMLPEHERVFQSSRLTAGNLLFPDRVRLEPHHVLYEKNGLIRRHRETIRYEQVSSVSVRRGLVFAWLVLETTGGTRPIVVNGLWAGDAEAARVAIAARMEHRGASWRDRVLALLEEQVRLLRRLAGEE